MTIEAGLGVFLGVIIGTVLVSAMRGRPVTSDLAQVPLFRRWRRAMRADKPFRPPSPKPEVPAP